MFLLARPAPRAPGPRTEGVPERSAHPWKRGKDFFIWIRCNPLKSPDLAKGIQGHPSLFPWFYLVLLGFIWRRSRTRGRARLFRRLAQGAVAGQLRPQRRG